MKRTKRMGIARLIRRRDRGQSIPLIALVIVILIAMVGLSVDVGNTFAEEREVVAASNTAALAGMNAFLRNRTAAITTVYEAINASLAANGVDPNNPSLTITRTFLDSKGSPVKDKSEIKVDPAQVPADAAYVQVKVTGTVDTYFARIVNRNTLPINATAYAGSCPAGNGVYPITVWSQYIQGDKFVNPGPDIPGEAPTKYKANVGGDYEGYSSRRIYLKAQANVPGGFSYLQWTDPSKGGGSAVTLADALGGFGNLSKGFEEMPWPSGYPNKPSVYPVMPGQLNAGDWVRSNTGLSNSNDVRAAIDGHINNQTKLILPIFDDAVDGGQNGAYHIVRMGLFVITEHGKENGKDYFNVIYLGDASQQRTACGVQPPPSTTRRLVGDVQFTPEYGKKPDGYKPVQYMVVFDVSGSMNATFNGIGTHPSTGADVQCTNGPNGEPNQNCGRPEYAYKDVTQRRVYVAKEALDLLVELTNMPGNPKYDPKLPKDKMALVWFDQESRADWQLGFTDDATKMRAAIKNAGSVNGDPYKTDGGTNGAAGLYRAAQIFQNAPKQTNELNQSWDYKRVVIFITDGVSNHFLDTGNSGLSGGQSNQGTYPKNSTCWDLAESVVEDAKCQTTEGGGKYKGKDRPVTEMVNIATNNIKANAAVGSEIYVISLSNIPATGLEDGVASSPSKFFPASRLEVRNGETNVDRIIRLIKGDASNTTCTLVTGAPQSTIGTNEFTALPEYGLAHPIVGEVRLVDANGVEKKAPIRAGENNKLTYEFADLIPGPYELTAYLFYKHPTGETVPRMYSWIYEKDENVGSISLTVEENPNDGFAGVQRRDLFLKAFAPACAAPTGS